MVMRVCGIAGAGRRLRRAGTARRWEVIGIGGECGNDSDSKVGIEHEGLAGPELCWPLLR
jgi:hypothetical protein